MKQLLLYIYLFIPFLGFLQNGNVESLEKQLRTAENDTVKVNLQNELVILYIRSDLHRAKELSQQALKLSTDLNYPKGKGYALTMLGVMDKKGGDTKAALVKYNKAIKQFEKVNHHTGMLITLLEIAIAHKSFGDFDASFSCYKKMDSISILVKDTTYMVEALNGFANVYRYKDKYVESLKYYIRAVKLANKADLKLLESISLANMAIIYGYQKKTKDELKVVRRSAKLLEEVKDTARLISIYSYLGHIYLDMDDFENARRRCLQAQRIAENFGYERAGLGAMAEIYENFGILYSRTEKFDDAVNSYKVALDWMMKTSDKKGIATLHGDLAEAYSNVKNYGEAENHAKQQMLLSEQMNYKRGVMHSSQILSELYHKKGDYRNAYLYSSRYSKLKDELLTQNSTEQMNEMQAKYESEKKEQEIILLQQERKSQARITDANDRRKNVVITSAFVGLFLILGFSIYFLRSLRINRRQKHMIEVKQREIVDSINYAKRLQQAILANPTELRKYLPQMFILYKPKDIVAGDFYWMEVKDEKIMFAAADCTGHGVPGALISMVCNNALNRSVREYGLTDPGEILNTTREIILQEFEKSEQEVNDGMDIALCCIENNILHYAGAHNPLWLIRKGELQVIKADKQPIGKFEQAKPFNTQVINLQEGDTIYIFTDGFSDQFGGVDGKKFLAAKFKQLLLSIQTADMQRQEQLLEEEFNQWKGEMDQVDDVCVIGVKV